MTGAPVLRISGLRTEFDTPRGPVRAVDGVDLAVADGETLAVVGESGSGKSVTALSILRLFTRADRARVAGRVMWRQRDGTEIDLASLDERDLRDIRGRDIAVVFQDPSASLNPVFSIGAQIREAVRRHRPHEDAAARAVDLLRDVGIADPERRVHSYPHQLSGGMRQRAVIAMALACAPRLLIADEPTTALDVTIQAQIMRLLGDLKLRLGMALVFITHDLALVGEIADRVAVMYAGQVVETGPVAEILRRPGHPYTRALLACRPERRYRDGAPDERSLVPSPGAPPRPGAVTQGCRFVPRCALAQDECRSARVGLAPVGGDRFVRCLRWRDVA
ncbi:MAG: ABC transporter ATP-binding protein [Rhodospirillales bacterium]